MQGEKWDSVTSKLRTELRRKDGKIREDGGVLFIER
jgi:hypothetical protein